MLSAGFSSDDSKVVCGDEAKKVTVLDAASGEVAWEQELGGEVRAVLARVVPCAVHVYAVAGCRAPHACSGKRVGCLRTL